MNIKKYITVATVAFFIAIPGSWGKEPVTLHLIPQPQSVVIEKGSFKMSGAAVNCDDKFDGNVRKAIQTFANDLTLASGKMSSYAAPSGLASTVAKGNLKGVAFLRDSSLGAEE